MRPRLRLARARGWRGRLVGLLGRRRPPGPRSGLLMAPCRAVHTWGMAYAIDVAFVGRDGRVLRLVRGLKPWRGALCVRAVAVVETRVGVIDPEHGGIGRVEAAIQHAARDDGDGNLQGAGQRVGHAHADQQADAQVDEQEHQDPDHAVHQERPFVAPAGNTREEQRLQQPQAVPAHQHGSMPEHGGDDHVKRGEHQQRRAHGRHDGREVVGRGHADAFGQRTGKRQERQQAGGQA
ncbi:DUF192 domain-containing protein [Bordetella pertussis]|nr:DUF192 domain-containing protein [Bordetella pertussis]QRR62104.1 DUF192 domain-containing protein [Bordetella pertussis]QRT84316.1 DUF192 domain-containing protein [Bordetella pertussis]QRT97564.1 DUF192 domain-containing protein [Bordetella pertussis]QRU11039.1 DUF192 domain-containing protein [Bordetella pertussis]